MVGRTSNVRLLAIVAVLVTVIGLGLGALRVKRKIRTFFEAEAARHGLVAHVEDVHVGLWPLVRLEGVRVEMPNSISVATKSLNLTPRLLGQGMVGRTRIASERLIVTLPGGFTVETPPAVFDLSKLPNGLRADLRSPGGLVLMAYSGSNGDHVEVQASGMPVALPLTIHNQSTRILEGGFQGRAVMATANGTRTFEADLSGHAVRLADLSNDAPPIRGQEPALGPPWDLTLKFDGSRRGPAGAFAVPHFRLRMDGLTLSGSVALADIPNVPRIDLALEVERVDFATLLRISGLDGLEAAALRAPDALAEGGLGSASLSARINGRIYDPNSLVVSQKLGFSHRGASPPPWSA